MGTHRSMIGLIFSLHDVFNNMNFTTWVHILLDISHEINLSLPTTTWSYNVHWITSPLPKLKCRNRGKIVLGFQVLLLCKSLWRNYDFFLLSISFLNIWNVTISINTFYFCNQNQIWQKFIGTVQILNNWNSNWI